MQVRTRSPEVLVLHETLVVALQGVQAGHPVATKEPLSSVLYDQCFTVAESQWQMSVPRYPMNTKFPQ